MVGRSSHADCLLGTCFDHIANCHRRCEQRDEPLWSRFLTRLLSSRPTNRLSASDHTQGSFNHLSPCGRGGRWLCIKCDWVFGPKLGIIAWEANIVYWSHDNFGPSFCWRRCDSVRVIPTTTHGPRRACFPVLIILAYWQPNSTLELLRKLGLFLLKIDRSMTNASRILWSKHVNSIA